MTAIDTPAAQSRIQLYIGYALSVLVVLFMLMDAGMKLVPLDVVLETQRTLGYEDGVARPLGILLLICTALYVFPRTSVLGAVLLTAYLGGAVATHVRIGNPLFSHVLFGVYLGLFVWGGLWLRDAKLRALFPWRR